MAKKKQGTIQVDLDGLWTNLKYYGYEADLEPDPIFCSSIPRFIELFEKHDVKATFFLIGKDCEANSKVKLVRDLVKAGHEIANHTYSHVFGFRKLSYHEKFEEVKKCGFIIEKITGKKPIGFKAPGYDVDTDTLKILEKQGYMYDSSLLPTFIYNFLMRINSMRSGGVMRSHGPRWYWCMAPNRMYRPSYKKEWRKGDAGIVEIPCTVMPFTRLPYHATFATLLGMTYFKLGHTLSKRFNIPLNYEFHSADLADDVQDKRMSHLDINFEKRYKMCDNMLKIMSKDYEFVTGSELVARFKR